MNEMAKAIGIAARLPQVPGADGVIPIPKHVAALKANDFLLFFLWYFIIKEFTGKVSTSQYGLDIKGGTVLFYKHQRTNKIIPFWFKKIKKQF